MKKLFLLLGLLSSVAFGAVTPRDKAELGTDLQAIVNGGCEAATAGYVTYADAAGALPVDGVSGTANVTFTAPTSSPLEGAASCVLTKDAANRQGQGASYAFSIPAKAQGKPLSIAFDYTVLSGTYATGDVGVYIYDVTNATVIQPAGFSIQSIVTGFPQKQIATFQTAINSTSYRLIFHVASTSASAYALKIDGITVGTQSAQYGAPVTDWVSFTPTGSWVTNTTYSGKYRRVGDSVQVRMSLTLAGAPTSAALTINLPSGLVIDTTKLSSTTIASTLPSLKSDGTLYDNGAAIHKALAAYNTTTSISVRYLTSSTGVIGNVTQAAPFTFGNTDEVAVDFEAPIVGFSSSVQMSNDTDTRVVSAYYNGTPSGTLTGSFNTTTFPTKVDDTHAAYSSGTYTVPVPGKYDVAAAATISAAWTLNSRAILSVFVNGVEVARGPWFKAELAQTTNHTTQVSVNAYPLNAGDLVTIRAFSDATTPTFAASESTYFNIARRSGPSAIAASEAVYANYYRNAVQSITSGATGADIIWDTKQEDSHNSMNTSTGVYTCPVPGQYSVGSQVLITSTAFNGTSAEYIQMEIRVNGTARIVAVRRPYSAEADPGHSVAGLVRCLAGQTITIRYIQVSGVNENTVGGVGYTAIGIVKVGN